MRQGTWADDPEFVNKISDEGVIRAALLESIGVPRSTIGRRCVAGGRWRRLLPGVVLLHAGSPTPRQRTLAALAYCGQGAVLTGRSALGEYGFGTSNGLVHILLPDRRRAHSMEFVLVERTTRLPQPEMRNGLPCAPIARAVLDAARRARTLDGARAVIAEVVQRGAVSIDDLREELAAGSIRGSALPRSVLDEVSDNVHSVAEADARKLWERSGLPQMVFNPDICDAQGQFIARPDGWIDSVGLAWQIDSLEWHLSPQQYKRTLETRTRMQSHQIIVLPTVPSAAHRTPERVIKDLCAHYRLAASRPRPDVHIRRTPG